MDQESFIADNHEANLANGDQLTTIDEAEIDANAQFSKESSENVPTMKDSRLPRRPRRHSSKSESAAESGDGHVHVVGHGVGGSGKSATGRRRCCKSRHRTGKLRSGEPKKGGAGGKGVWGKPGSELNETGICKDVNDPNYDSDAQGEYKLEKVDPVLTEEELEKVVKPIIQEYLEHGNSYEVEMLLNQLNLYQNRHKVMRIAVLLGLDRHNPQRELISRLISDLYTYVLSQQDIANGFDELLASLDDLHLDTPEAPSLLGQFIARCVADDCLPPKFIHS